MKPGIVSIWMMFILILGSIMNASGVFAADANAAFTMQQTLSDGAQRMTIAFDGLTFITGSLGADSFFPPGKVADFWGFQYLRDNDPSNMGHNTDFLTRAALNMLYVLTSAQRAELISLGRNQVASINQYGYERFVLMKAFRRLLENDLPAGTTGLNKDAVIAYSAQLYRLDGQISYERAALMGRLLSLLDADQRAYLDAMVGKGMLEWPVVGEPDDLKGLEHDVKVAVMTYAGDMFSWYAGTLDADVYFCPERQGTYFGSFYFKDAPAVGNPGYTIPSNLTADMGDAFLKTLTTEQAALITNLVSEQKPALWEIVDRRAQVSALLRQFQTGSTPDQASVLDLMERYGELDGDIVARYVNAFVQVAQSLTTDQRAALSTLRTDYLADLSIPAGAYLYSQAIAMPTIADTDFLFSAETSTNLTYPVVDTGQEQCYNGANQVTCPASGAAFYGQDAQTTTNAPSYTVSVDGLSVLDNVTGLTWERSPETSGDNLLNTADKLTYANALAHCSAHSGANYLGYNDWRLPSIKELYSLIQFNGTDPSGYSGTDTSTLKPFIDTTAFVFAYGDTSAGERIIDSQYASSSVYVLNPGDSGSTKLFGVNFADGRIKGYDLVMPGSLAEKKFFVQCVRGSTSYGINAFVDHGDQTISDTATGLMWSKADSGSAMDWQTALAWVQAKNAANYLGHNDWRLPDAKEIQSILDYSRSPATSGSAALNAIFDATSFTNEGGQTDWPWYWSSTTHASYNGKGAAAVYLAFGRAGGWQKANPADSCYNLYDVHGAGAQRSDPKTSSGLVIMGTACSGGTAYGLGPQGDVQRAANYVRLVRSLTNGGTEQISISGNAGAGQLTINYGAESTSTASDGSYVINVAKGWTGSVTPSRSGFSFSPASRSYTNLQSSQAGQDFNILRRGASTAGVFRTSNGALYLKNSNTSGYADIQINYGLSGDYPVTGDWDGDGADTIGIYRDGAFYLRNSNTIGVADLVIVFGAPGDLPVAGDWDGDGVDTIGVYREGVFFLRNANTSGSPEVSFSLGIPGDVGIAGDWDGDGLDTTGVFRPSNGALYLKNTNSSGYADIQINYGLAGDKPVTGDWDNDGTDTIGVYRGGTFMLRNSNTIGYADIYLGLGIEGDMPIAGNWDGLP